MAGTFDVHAARIPDRDQLLQRLREHGLQAEPHGELDIRVECEDGAQASDDLFGHVESVVMDLGAQMIPLKHDGVIYLRPPLS